MLNIPKARQYSEQLRDKHLVVLNFTQQMEAAIAAALQQAVDANRYTAEVFAKMPVNPLYLKRFVPNLPEAEIAKAIAEDGAELLKKLVHTVEGMGYRVTDHKAAHSDVDRHGADEWVLRVELTLHIPQDPDRC